MIRQSRMGSSALFGAVAAMVVTLAPGLALAAPAHAAPAAKVAASSVARATAPAVFKAAASSTLWTKTSSKLPASRGGHLREVSPSAYKAYTLDDSALADVLDAAPSERASNSSTTITLPAPDGTLVAFKIVQTQMMQAGLAAAHPEITTYAGKAVDSNASVVMESSPYGFHASVRGSGAMWYVDPAYVNDGSVYLSYLGTSLPEPPAFKEREMAAEAIKGATPTKTSAQPRLGEPADGLVTRRTYRLALITDNTYAEYVAPGLNDGAHDAQSNSVVLAAKMTLMDRVNQAYTNDMAVRMLMVNGSDKLNLNTAAKVTGANGPCGSSPCYTAAQVASCGSSTLTRNRYVDGLLIGAANFDIGHIGVGVNGGGIASLGVVGATSKAQGCTGIPTPVGDFYAIDYVAHEMGHEFSGNHPFNGTVLNCSTSNRNANTSVEPGSGTSIMAYAGICGSDDLQPHSDPYFSQRSQQEITAYLTKAPTILSEQQMGALTGFNTDGYSFTLTFPSYTNSAGTLVAGGTTAPIVRNTGGTITVPAGSQPYSAAGIKAAIEAVIGGTETITGIYASGTPTTATTGDYGFTIAFAGTNATTDVSNPTLTVVNGPFTGTVSDIVKGGLTTQAGTQDQPDGNHAPNVTVPGTMTIPTRTPFTLTGSATDLDPNTTLYYLWEQNDVGAPGTAGGTGLITQPKLTGPLFAMFGTSANVTPAGTLLYQSPGENLVTTNPSRTFPDLNQILAGSTNQATGSCPTPTAADTKTGVAGSALKLGPILDCFAEFLPTSAYNGTAATTTVPPTPANNEPSLNFRLTARDQDPVDGGYQFAQTKLLIDKTAGPLYVTALPNAGGATLAGGTQTVTWDVNSTDKPALAPTVKISLSTDGGQTFPTVLDAATANDGSDDVTIPNVSTTQARIKIEAVGNVFFDISHANFTISALPDAVTAVTATAGNARVHLDFTPAATGPAATSYVITQTTGDNVGSTTTISAPATSADISGLTNGVAYAFTITPVIGTSPSLSGPASAPSNTVTPRVDAGEYFGLTPTRILDTRSATGLTGGSPLVAGVGDQLIVPVLGQGGVPAAGVRAVVVNLTAVDNTRQTFVSALTSPASDTPTTSNLNLFRKFAKAVQVTVPVAPDGSITLYNYRGTVDTILDVVGYYGDGTGFEAGRVHLQSAQRLLDTRSGQGLDGGTPAKVGEGQFVDVQVTGNAGVPAGATAVIMNLTGVNPSKPTFVRATSPTNDVSTTSSLNVDQGTVVPNLVTVPLSAAGKMRLFNAAGTIDLLADISGYITAPSDATGASYASATNHRVLDTRYGPGTTGRVGAGQTVETAVDAPTGATGVLYGLTSVAPSANTFLSVNPAGAPSQATSNLNSVADDITSNAGVSTLGTDGTVTNGIGITNAAGTDDILVDVEGYFVP